MNKINLKQQLEAFNQGIILDSEGDENECYNFYDWFCKDKALKGKATKLYKQVKRWVKFRNTDTEKVYVFFKNNCPMFGSLYDDLETGDVIWNVTAKSGHTHQAEVWGRLNNFQEAIAVGKNLNEIYKQSF